MVDEKSKIWREVFEKHNPNITDKEINYILWSETCYPFDDEIAVKQVEEYFKKLNTVLK